MDSELTRRSAPRLTAKGRATRARIVETAARLVFERGVSGTSIEDVRREAGVSGSQVSHYFADKQSLVRAVVQRQAAAVAGQPTEDGGTGEAGATGDGPGAEPLPPLDSHDALTAWAGSLVDHQRSCGCVGGCPFGSLASALAETDDETRAHLAEGFARWQQRLSGGLAAMRDRGELRDDADPDRLAFGLLAALQGGLLIAQTMRDPAPLEAALQAMLDHLRELTPPAAT